MCLSRIGWPRRDGLTSYNRLSPRRIGVLHGSSTFSSSLLLSLSLSVCDARLTRRATSSLTACHTLGGGGGALVRCAHCFHGEARDTPREKKGRLSPAFRATPVHRFDERRLCACASLPLARIIPVAV